MPSLIVKVRADEETIQTENGRESMRKKFLESEEANAPWIVPDDIMDVEQVKPLTLQDIAINESVTNYKKTVAGLLGVPAFLLGEGTFNEKEYNLFVRSKILSIAKVIEQTLTKQLLVNPNWYFKFNDRSLYAYDFDTKANVGASLYDRGIITGNEVRDWLDMSPMDGLDELITLENYIPQKDIGNQKKLESENGDTPQLQSDEDPEDGGT